MNKDCRQYKLMVGNADFSALSPDERQRLKIHLDSCERCRLRFEQDTYTEQLLSDAIGGSKSLPESSPHLRRQSALRLAPIGASAALICLLAAVGYEAGYASARTQVPEVNPELIGLSVEATDLLSGLSRVGWSNPSKVGGVGYRIPFESGRWSLSPTARENFAALDGKVVHSTGPSLRLRHGPFGGGATLEIIADLPARTLVQCGYWFLSPEGGNPQDKWLTASLALRDSDEHLIAAATHGMFDANPNWRPVIFSAEAAQPVKKIELTFSTANGDGNQKRDIPSSWVDDVCVWIVAPLRTEEIYVSRHSVEAAFHLPDHITVSQMDVSRASVKGIYPSRYEFRLNRDEIKLLPEKRMIELSINRRTLVDALWNDNPDVPGTPAGAQFNIPCEVGGATVTFVAGIDRSMSRPAR